jgi:hypothetical protein
LVVVEVVAGLMAHLLVLARAEAVALIQKLQVYL